MLSIIISLFVILIYVRDGLMFWENVKMNQDTHHQLLRLGLEFQINGLQILKIQPFIHNLNIVDMTEALAALPRRNQGSYLKNYSKQCLKTNLYKVSFAEKSTVTIYCVNFQPFVQDERMKFVLESVSTKIKEKIGNYIICGRNIYGCAKPKQGNVKFQSNLGNQKYSITLRPVRTVELSDLNGDNKKNANGQVISLNFFNNLVKNFFQSLKFVSIGKSGKYFNPKTSKVLSNSGVILFNGYETKFNLTQTGLYLQVDSMVRIVQTKTVLQQINSVYSKNSHLSKQQKRNAVKCELEGKAVMSNYGNSRVWVIKQVLFEFDLENNKIAPESNMTFPEYYDRTYGMKIKNKKQPVLKAVLNGTRKSKITKQSILIPEFLLLSGLPEDFDERKRRDISQYTIVQPEQKLYRIQSLIKAFNSQSQNFCPNSVSQNLGIKISETTQTVEATLLPPPTIQLGKGDSIERGKTACFQLFNKQIYRHDVPVNIVVIIPQDFDFSPTEKLFISTCRNLCIKNNLNVVKINFQDTRRAMTDIEKLIIDKQGKLDDYDLNWFILPPNMKSNYKTIKILSLKNENPKVTQVTLTSTLAKKGFASILTKVLLQISSKLGNIPWAPKLPASMNPKTILIGIDTGKGSGGKNSIVAYCCTLDQEMCKIHSNYQYQQQNNNFCTKMGDIIADCLIAYSKVNSYLPEQIIMLKTDLSDGEKDSIVAGQIAQIRAKLKDMNGYLPKLTFLTANKNSKQKFFLQARNITNPSYGTLINTKVVSKNYDFYLISQHCNRGTVKPIHYKVLYTDSKMEEGLLQELIYSQSFNYMNWSGSVRVPSVLQYASKLCNFISDYISKGPETDQLNDLLYYI